MGKGKTLNRDPSSQEERISTTWHRRWMKAAFQWWYYLAMYSGIRALHNCFRSRFFALAPNLKRLHKTHLSSEKLGELIVHVHPRARPLSAKELGHYGVFSIQQQNPSVGRAAYRYFCMTSHFGCGHLEIAYYQRGCEVTYYGVRNIARANALRIGLFGLASDLRLAKHHENALVLRAVSSLLQKNGFATRHAEPEECLNLALDPRLLRDSMREATRSALFRKYDKLQSVMDSRCT